MAEYPYYITPEQYDKAAKNGINKKRLETRVRSLGWDIDRAMTEELNKGRRFLPKELIDKAEKNGINRRLLYNRVRKGMYEKEAATMPKKERIKNGSEARRVYSPEMIELAKKNGIDYPTFRNRVKYGGLSEKEAATKPVMSRKEIGAMMKKRHKAGK